MMSVNKIVLSFLFVLLSLLGWSQELLVNVQFFSQKDGLSDRSVFCVQQDDRGLMWIGTGNGLNHFDGEKIISIDDETHPLATGVIHGIKKTSTGNFWIQKDGSAIFYDPLEELVLPLPSIENVKYGELQILEPGGLGKSIFFKNEFGRIFYAEGNEIKPFGEITFSDDVRLWPTSWGTMLVTKSNPRSTTEVNQAGQKLRSFEEGYREINYFDQEGDHIYLGQLGRDLDTSLSKMLFAIEKEGALKPILLKKNNELLELKQLNARKGMSLRLTKDSQERIWVTIGTNLFLFDPEGNFLKDLSPELRKITRRNWKDNQLYVDNSDRLWISTEVGLFVVQVKENPFEHYLEGRQVSTRGIVELSDNRLLIANYDGTKVLNKNTKEIIASVDDDGLGVTQISQDTFLLGKHGPELLVFDQATNTFNRERVKKRRTRLHGSVPFFDPISERLYLGTLKGLKIKDETLGEFVDYDQYNTFKDLSRRTIVHFYSNAEGIWICTDKGLYLLDRDKGIVKKYQFSFDRIVHLYEDEKNDFWLATSGGGLIYWNRETDERKSFTTKDGLSHNVLYAVYEDESNCLWLPSDKGLMRFEKSTGEVLVFQPDDGITHHEFNTYSHFKAPDGRFYFGGLNGVTAFYPEEVRLVENNAPFIITRFQKFDAAEGLLLNKTKELISTGEIILNPSDKFFTLDFSLLDYSARDNIYAWRINGIDKDWNYQTEASIRINALYYGEYSLEIKAKGAGGQWAKQQLNIPIMIRRPVYLQPPFIGGFLLLIAGSLGALFRYRTARLRARAKELAEEVAQRTQTIRTQNEELKKASEFKDKILALVAHDLRAPLITLSGLTRKINFLIRKERIDDVAKLSTTIDNSTAGVTILLDNILNWALVQQGQFRIEPERLNLKEVVADIVTLYTHTAEAKSIHIETMKEDLMVDVDRNSIETTIRNLLNNAIKFSRNEGIISIRKFENDKGIGVEVKDHGIGIPPEMIARLFKFDRKQRVKGTKGEKGTGFGLMLCQELMHLNKGRIEVASTEGQGSSFFIILPKIEENP